jgi:hypothetical protein
MGNYLFARLAAITDIIELVAVDVRRGRLGTREPHVLAAHRARRLTFGDRQESLNSNEPRAQSKSATRGQTQPVPSLHSGRVKRAWMASTEAASILGTGKIFLGFLCGPVPNVGQIEEGPFLFVCFCFGGRVNSFCGVLPEVLRF